MDELNMTVSDFETFEPDFSAFNLTPEESSDIEFAANEFYSWAKDNGGMVSAVEDGFIRKRVEASMRRKAEAIIASARRQAIVELTWGKR